MSRSSSSLASLLSMLALVLPLTLSVGCQDPGSDDNGMDAETSAELSYANDIQPIWDANCVSYCHEPGGLGAPLDLSAGYMAVVNVPSMQASVDLVEPGSPATSYLLAKLRGIQADLGGQGIQMPAGGAAALDTATIDIVEAWIVAGAPP